MSHPWKKSLAVPKTGRIHGAQVKLIRLAARMLPTITSADFPVLPNAGVLLGRLHRRGELELVLPANRNRAGGRAVYRAPHPSD